VAVALTEGSKLVRLKRLLGATALACLFAYGVLPQTAHAQALDLEQNISPNAQMLLEADTLVYDNDNRTVTAVGGVQIDYDGNRLVAQRVTYHRNSNRLVASGAVQIIEKDGNKIYSDEIDITDDFRDGFVNALRVETPDKTYFAAESADREGGVVTTFNNGVYTACEPCEEKPDRAPVWRIKARKIIWDGKAKTVRFENSRFEMFGFPIAYLPAFEVADPTVKRKTGFLIPGITYNSDLGVGAIVPFYIALSPTYDLTVQGRYYTRQGFLGQAEWRQRFNNGQYNLKIAGIRQGDPDAFDLNTVDRGTVVDPTRFRGMVATKGDFVINQRWTAGWDIMVQTDKNFSRTYTIGGYSALVNASQVYLTGLGDRNFFDLRGYRFQVQESIQDRFPTARNKQQPWVLPSFDYSFTSDEPVAGGEFNLDINSKVIYRDTLDENFQFEIVDGVRQKRVTAVRGIEGTNGRVTADAEWKRSFVSDGGLVVTPLLAFQADSTYVNQTAASVEAINAMASNPQIGVASDIRSAYYRYMATAGLDLRWPVLFSSTSSTHVLEPVAQLFARPSEQFAETLGIPNEDAQSFVFDATTLFERDKFSGYDRIEGGTRANVGFRYSGTFAGGWTSNAIFGQSYQLAGENSFAGADLVNVGAFSGLETERSDYVGLVGFATPFGLSASASTRLDEQTLEVRRAELRAGLSTRMGSLTAKYAFIQAQPLYGFPTDRKEVTLSATARLHEYWKVFGSGTYDFETNMTTRDSFGFAYDDECFSYSMTFSETRNTTTRETSQTVGFNISFRTIGDFGSSSLGSLQ
jgi:LPS-assembly protein